MKKIRLCIGSNDGENVAKTHMGDTEYFYIYDLFESSEHLRDTEHKGTPLR